MGPVGLMIRGVRLVPVLLAVLLVVGGVVAVPAAAAPGPSCATGDPALLNGQLRSGGLVRRYEVHLPARRDPRRPLPVLLAFHGRGEPAARLRGYTGFDAADAVVLYPEGRPTAGPQPTLAWEGTLDHPVDGVDVAFVRDLLAEVGRRVCTDPRRTFATGSSQGGGFTHTLACSAPGLLAAIAPVAGAFYRPESGGVRECRSGPLRVVEIHGDADPVIGYTGTERSRPIPEWLAEWTTRDGCGRPVDRPLPPDVSERRWAPCSRGGEVLHYLVRGGNHGWPGAPAPAVVGPGNRTTTISATAVVLSFTGIPRTPAP